MQRIGSIGPRRTKIPFLFKLLCLLLTVLLLTLFLNMRLHTMAAALGQNELSYYFSTTVTNAMKDRLAQKEAAYRDLVTLSFKDGGEVAAVTTNMPLLLSLQNDVCQTVFASYASLSSLSLSVPFLWLFGLDFLSSVGPSTQIEVIPARFLHTYYTSEFEEAGINQTRHRIVFHVEGTFTLLFPQGKEKLTVLESYCLTETLIVGKVPDAYTEINRLTDDIVESEIDDLYDFGASTQ